MHCNFLKEISGSFVVNDKSYDIGFFSEKADKQNNHNLFNINNEIRDNFPSIKYKYNMRKDKEQFKKDLNKKIGLEDIVDLMLSYYFTENNETTNKWLENSLPGQYKRHPFGESDYPDFQVRLNTQIINIECKSSIKRNFLVLKLTKSREILLFFL